MAEFIGGNSSGGGGGGGGVQIGGQIGGTNASPDVRGLRETAGPTLLTLGAVADGEYVRRVGSTLVGGTPAGGSSGYAVLPTLGSAIGLWRFLGNLNDSSGNGYTLTAAAGTPTYEVGPNGRRAVIFENSALLQVTNAAFGTTGSFAIELLFRSAALNNQNIVGVLTSGFAAVNWLLSVESGSLVLNQVASAGFYAVTAGRVPMDGGFHHIVVNRTVSGGSTTVDIYIDGQLSATDTRTTTPVTAGNTLSLMSEPGGTGAVVSPSSVAGAAFHNAILSLSDIQSRARATLPPGYGPP